MAVRGVAVPGEKQVLLRREVWDVLWDAGAGRELLGVLLQEQQQFWEHAG